MSPIQLNSEFFVNFADYIHIFCSPPLHFPTFRLVTHVPVIPAIDNMCIHRHVCLHYGLDDVVLFLKKFMQANGVESEIEIGVGN